MQVFVMKEQPEVNNPGISKILGSLRFVDLNDILDKKQPDDVIFEKFFFLFFN